MALKNRLNLIKQQVEIDQKVKVSELSKLYQVTEETIRRDLEKLEAEGFLTRTHGGAVLNVSMPRDNVHFLKRALVSQTEKKQIAVAAFDILKQKRTIATDSSTTVMEAIKLLKDLETTILTVSTEIFHELIDTNLHIISSGGTFNKNTLSLHGQVAKDTIKKYNVDLAVLSCKCLDLEQGATDTNENETEVKQCMINHAERVALLVDHTKFGRRAFTHLIGFEDVDYIITDREPSKEWMDVFKENNVIVIY